MKIKLLLVFTLVIPLAACVQNIEQPNLEDLSMIGVLGYDYIDEKQIKITVAVPQPAEGAKEKTQNFTETGSMTHEVLKKLSAKSESTMSMAQTRVIIFSEEYAKQEKIESTVSRFYRDANTGDNVYIAVVDGTAEELLTYKYRDKPQTSVYFNNLLHPRVATAFISFTDIHHYMHSVKSLEQDPVLPYLKKQDGQVSIENLALFQKNKLVGLINQEEGTVLESLRDTAFLPNIEMELPEDSKGKEEKIVINTVQNSSNIKLNVDKRRPSVDIKIKITGGVVEYEGDRDLSLYSDLMDLEERIEQRYKERTLALLEKFQEYQVDPVGFGGYFRAKYGSKHWTEKRWRKEFSELDFNIKVDFSLKNTGSMK